LFCGLEDLTENDVAQADFDGLGPVSRSTEAKTWHGRLQGAQNSTWTGWFDAKTSALKSLVAVATRASFGVFIFLDFSNITKLDAQTVP